jgi:aryl-phospho-beta-D-glucosidase BglC (GH1 family)
MTGLFSGETRLATTYRNQWKSVSTPFTTATVAADFQLLNDRIGNDIMGIGIMGMLDQSNNQGLKSNFISLAAAYNKNLDNNGRHKIGVGFQGGLQSIYIFSPIHPFWVQSHCFQWRADNRF